MLEKDYNIEELDKVSHQLSSLYVTKNQVGVTTDQEPNPMLTIENLQPSMLKFDIGCNNPSLKSKNKVKMSGYKSQKHDSTSTLTTGSVPQDHIGYLAMKRRSEEFLERKKGKRVCMDQS
ncbi:hypothetical protein TanjilG_17724 [Lupinus angustifolius]|nr:hypothetical protein TanjilG_17724 [Lupinus angustifolius]